ncbi:hypothetical protein WICMUC_004728 [Wickerhamomyces mucosus]|uniref:HMG box domain-containing protein n=1 Tax=Wickerhamomyces mucosus TaxID=1378264 RepID=A0A9P8TAL1_9ASCO|nr:hypothetical protein WICMUC_004728 [Wickerhamomyces mucosus]
MSLKSAKDSLVSALFELSKAANDASSATIDFYNASLLTGSTNQDTEIFNNLSQSLKLLTNAVNSVHATSNQIQAHNQVNFALDPALTDISINNSQFPVAVQQLPTQASQQPFPHHQISQQVEQQKKKVEKDPNAPKKPLTVFFAYSAWARQSLRDDRLAKGLPSLSSTEITQEISKKWNELPETEKDLWKQAYDNELKLYQIEKARYLEAKKLGHDVTRSGPNNAPVPLPDFLKSSSKVDSADDKKDKKKKSTKKRKTDLPDF